jgi:hypothetical protein
LYTGGPDTFEEGVIDVVNPAVILRLDTSVEVPKKYLKLVVDAPCGHLVTPNAEVLDRWVSIGLPILKAKKLLLILCNEGNNRSCTVASVLLALHTKRPWHKVLDELHEMFLTQGHHNWWPYWHWKQGLSKNWAAVMLKHQKDIK